MKVGAESTYASGQCGIGVWHSFKEVPEGATDYNGGGALNSAYWGWGDYQGQHEHYSRKLTLKNNKGGCGFSGTGFIDTPICKVAYEQMCRDFRLVFQTPVRKNKNSNNMFFYAMFDDGPSDDIPSITPCWPFASDIGAK